MSATATAGPVTVADLVTALRSQQAAVTQFGAPSGTAMPLIDPAAASDRIVVVGAHPGAGASAVAVAVADAAASESERRGRVLLLDEARPEASGLTSVSEAEILSPVAGCRAGRRGGVTVLARSMHTDAVSAAPGGISSVSGLWVVDTARPWRDVAQDLRGADGVWAGSQLVVVCRATVPGIRHAEAALAGLPGRALLTAVGATRWPPTVRASFGPHVSSVVAGGRAVLVPADRRLGVDGIDQRPLPRAVTVAASRLLPLALPEVFRPHQTSRRRVFS